VFYHEVSKNQGSAINNSHGKDKNPTFLSMGTVLSLEAQSY
jgi:hypothetical protein